MEEKKDVADSSTEKVEVASEGVKTPEVTPEVTKTEEKTVPYSRFQEIVEENKKLKNKPPVVKTSFDVEELVGITTSLEGLTPREKEYLIKQNKLTGQPIGDIKQSEDFLMWQSGYKEKVVKEKTLSPSSKQPDIDAPVTLEQALKEAKTPQEKEQLLKDAGLYSERGQRADRVNRR